jgi:hypothetical protein
MNIGLHPSTPFGLASLEHGPFGFCMPLMMLYVDCSLMKALLIFFFKYVLFTSSKMCFVWRAIDECSTLPTHVVVSLQEVAAVYRITVVMLMKEVGSHVVAKSLIC